MPILLYVALLLSLRGSQIRPRPASAATRAAAGGGAAPDGERAASKPGPARFLPNKSIGLNITAIAAGVAFFTFALAIYDSYRAKVETMIFSLNPHVMLRPAMQLGGEGDASLDETQRCEKVCRTPFSVHVKDEPNARQPLGRFETAKVDAVRSWLKSANFPGASLSRVLFEEQKLEIAVGGYTSGGARPMRLLGIERLLGANPAPRVDLTFADAAVKARFERGEGVLISDALAGEIAREGGPEIRPGSTRLKVGPQGHARDVLVAGIHSLGIHAISRNLIIAPYKIAADLLADAAAEGPSFLGIDIPDPSVSRVVAREAKEALQTTDIAAVPWQATTNLFDQLELYRWIIIVTLGLSGIVTMINTFVNVNILVMERAQHIGIMRAMGLGPGKMQAVFLLIGVLQSLVGTVLGYAAGLLTGYLLNDYINSLVREFIPITNTGIRADAHVFGMLLAFITVVSVIACLLAGRRLLKSEIITNLRSV